MQSPALAGLGCGVGRTESVQANAAALLALDFLGVTLDCGSSFTLALGSGLFVELAATDFSQYTGFFARTLKATQSYVEWFVLFDFNVGHPGRTFTCLPVTTRFGKYREHAGFKGCGC